MKLSTAETSQIRYGFSDTLGILKRYSVECTHITCMEIRCTKHHIRETLPHWRQWRPEAAPYQTVTQRCIPFMNCKSTHGRSRRTLRAFPGDPYFSQQVERRPTAPTEADRALRTLSGQWWGSTTGGGTAPSTKGSRRTHQGTRVRLRRAPQFPSRPGRTLIGGPRLPRISWSGKHTQQPLGRRTCYCTVTPYNYNFIRDYSRRPLHDS